MERAASFAIALLAACLAAGSCGRSSPAVQYPVDAASLPPESQFLAGVDRTMGTRDCFTPITDGRFVLAGDARRMRDGERVLGVVVDGAAVAYPVLLLNYHEIVEHTVAGQELLVCW